MYSQNFLKENILINTITNDNKTKEEESKQNNKDQNDSTATDSINKDHICIICVSCQKHNQPGSSYKSYCQPCYDASAKHYKEYKEMCIYPDYHKIEDEIYLGNYDAALKKDELYKNKITHVLVCANFLDQQFKDDFTYKQLELEDIPSQNISSSFIEAIKFIDEAAKQGGGIYVHCFAGISRSATIVIAYLMWKNKLSFEEAKAFVRSKRSIIYPNNGFQLQLKEFENLLKEKDYNIF